MPARRPCERAGGRGFNPRPALRPGDAVDRMVSQPLSEGFNPRPALRPGDAHDVAIDIPPAAAFQSAPGLEAGRCKRCSPAMS